MGEGREEGNRESQEGTSGWGRGTGGKGGRGGERGATRRGHEGKEISCWSLKKPVAIPRIPTDEPLDPAAIARPRDDWCWCNATSVNIVTDN